MNQGPTLTIQLSSEEHDRLATVARQHNLTPEAYTYQLLQQQLAQTSPEPSSLVALRRLRAIGRSMTPIDAVQMIRQGRDELIMRGEL